MAQTLSPEVELAALRFMVEHRDHGEMQLMCKQRIRKATLTAETSDEADKLVSNVLARLQKKWARLNTSEEELARRQREGHSRRHALFAEGADDAASGSESATSLPSENDNDE